MENKNLTSVALLVLRLVLGSVMLAHGLQKVGVLPGGAASLNDFIAKSDFPAWLSYLHLSAELLGGLGLILGLLGRLASFGIAVTMVVAIIKVHWPRFFASEGGMELPLSLCAMAMALMFTGMGQYSLDAKLARKMDGAIGGTK
jgi:putative oxidoreductase